MIYTIELPLPPRLCSPNQSGRSWYVRHRSRMQYKDDCGWGFREALLPKLVPPVTLNLDFYLCRNVNDSNVYRPRDQDNAVASVKGMIDALKEGGYIKDDSAAYVKLGAVSLKSRKKEHQGKSALVVTIVTE